MTPERTDLPTHHLLGVSVNAMTTDDLLRVVESSIRSGERTVLGNHNLHSVYLYHRDPAMREFYARARYVFVDGMPLVWSAKALGLPLRGEHRHAPLDWIPLALARAAREGWRVYFLGCTEEVARRGEEVLRERFPGLEIATSHGFFDAAPGSPEAEAVLERIRDFRPHILCVGMGMPRQERWIAAHGERTGANVVINVGALMELFVGALPIPPRWIGRIGLEWLFRLVSRPHRVWRRYLLEPWFLLPLFLRDLRGRPRRSRS